VGAVGRSLPCQLNVAVAPLTAGAVFRVRLGVIGRSSRHHAVVVAVVGVRLEEDGRLVGAEILLVGENVAFRRRRFATVNSATATTCTASPFPISHTPVFRGTQFSLNNEAF